MVTRGAQYLTTRNMNLEFNFWAGRTITRVLWRLSPPPSVQNNGHLSGIREK